jgi:hypothetical protein
VPDPRPRRGVRYRFTLLVSAAVSAILRRARSRRRTDNCGAGPSDPGPRAPPGMPNRCPDHHDHPQPNHPRGRRHRPTASSAAARSTPPNPGWTAGRVLIRGRAYAGGVACDPRWPTVARGRAGALAGKVRQVRGLTPPTSHHHHADGPPPAKWCHHNCGQVVPGTGGDLAEVPDRMSKDEQVRPASVRQYVGSDCHLAHAEQNEAASHHI